MNHRQFVKWLHGGAMGILAGSWIIVFVWVSLPWSLSNTLIGILFAAIYAEFEYRRVKVQIPGWDSSGISAAQPRTIVLTLSAAPLTVAALVANPITGVFIAGTSILISLRHELNWHRNNNTKIDNQSLTDIYFNFCLVSIVYGMVVAWSLWWNCLDFSYEHIARSIVGLLALVVAVPLWDSIIFAILVKVRSGRPLWSILREMFGPDVLVLGLVVTIGVLGSIAWQLHPVLALPSLLGCIGARWALQAVATWLADQQKIRTLASQLTVANTELREAKETLELRVMERTEHINKMAQQRIDAAHDSVHDAKNLLRAVEANIDVFVLQNASILVNSVFYQRVKQAINSLRNILMDSLDTATMEAGVSNLITEPFSVKQAVLAVRNQIESRCSINNTIFTVERIDDTLLAFGDRRRIERVLYNLCDNAINYAVDYSEQVGQIPWVHLWITIDDDAVGFNITDNGPGLQEPDLVQLGARGFRLTSNGASLEGSGMGINFCIRTLKLHGGALNIHSDGLGFGSTFTAWVPRWQHIEDQAKR